jgi:hypothetical protein
MAPTFWMRSRVRCGLRGRGPSHCLVIDIFARFHEVTVTEGSREYAVVQFVEKLRLSTQPLEAFEFDAYGIAKAKRRYDAGRWRQLAEG